jgi:hypothetical protein
MAERSPREVLADHLHQAAAGDIETDLARNHAEDVGVLTGFGAFRGHEGLREANRRLQRELPGAAYRYHTVSECAHSCLTGGQADAMSSCIRLCLDAATVTGACAETMARRSQFSAQLCGACADVCDACAQECDQYEDDVMRCCAEACRRCAETCRRMAA